MMHASVSDEPMDTDGDIVSDRKTCRVIPSKRVREEGNQSAIADPGTASPTDKQPDMQTDEHDASDSMTGKNTTRALHSQLVAYLQANLVPAMEAEYRSFLNVLASHLDRYDLEQSKEGVGDILNILERRNKFGIGNYNVLLQILNDAKLILLIRQVELRKMDILKTMEADGKSVPPEHKAPLGTVNQISREHTLLRQHLHEQLVPQMREYRSFTNNAKAYLPRGRVANNQNSAVDILDMLEEDGFLLIGNYSVLEMILKSSGLNALQEEVAKRGSAIRKTMSDEGIAVPDLQPSDTHSKSSDEQHADIFDCIERNLDQDDYQSFLTVITGVYLPQGELETYENIVGILEAMESQAIFFKGNYSKLITILNDAHLNAISASVQKQQNEIRDTMSAEGLTIPELIPESAEHRNIGRLHNSLLEFVSRNLSPKMHHDYRRFLAMARTYLSGGVLSANKETTSYVLRALQRDGQIMVGNCNVLLDILHHSALLNLKTEVERKQLEIQDAMREAGKEIPEIKRIEEENKSSEQQHRDLFSHIDSELDPIMPDYVSFLNAAKAYLPSGILANSKERALGILDKLESEGFIQKGNYKVLLDILKISKLLKLHGEVKSKRVKIRLSMEEEGISIEPVKVNLPESERLHRQLLGKVHRNIPPKALQYRSFLTNIKIYLDKGVVANNRTTAAELLTALETAGKLGVGNYGTLVTILQDAHLSKLASDVSQDQKAIKSALKRETST